MLVSVKQIFANINPVDGELNLDRRIIKHIFLIVSLILFIVFELYIFCDFAVFQELRHSDPLWLIHHLYPIYYVIIALYLIMGIFMLYLKCDSRMVHISYLSLLSLVIYGAPYFVSTYARFPDTISVSGNILALENILLNQPYSYPANYPASYIFFKCINMVANIDLLYFSRIIFAPLCLVAIIIMWYIFITRQVNSQVAFLSSLLIIPTQIVEISITPNSFAILLMLTALVLYSSSISNIKLWSFQNNHQDSQQDTTRTFASHHIKKHNCRKIRHNILLLMVMGVLVFAHPVNAVVLLVMLSIFYASDKVFATRNFGVSLKGILFLCLVWVWWLVSITASGESLVRTLYRMLSTESVTENVIHYSAGNTGLIYSYIDQLFALKYVLYGFIALLLLLFIMHELIHNKDRNHFQVPLTFLAISGVLVMITMLNLMRGGYDIQNILSRTLNFAMYSLCTFIAYSLLSVIDLKPKISQTMRVAFVLFLVVTLLTYPIYSFARDSYINYPVSEGAGQSFTKENCLEGEKFYVTKSKAAYFYSYMYGEITYEELTKNYNTFVTESKIYSNNWYSRGVRT